MCKDFTNNSLHFCFCLKFYFFSCGFDHLSQGQIMSSKVFFFGMLTPFNSRKNTFCFVLSTNQANLCKRLTVKGNLVLLDFNCIWKENVGKFSKFLQLSVVLCETLVLEFFFSKRVCQMWKLKNSKWKTKERTQLPVPNP